MGCDPDPSPQLQQYAHPEKLVTSSWLGARLGSPRLKVVESDEDSLLYDIGHIPTATRIDLRRDLNDPVQRDFIDGEAFARLMDSRGISRDDTVVVYGDRSNLWAAHTLWVLELFGHPDVRLLDGGRDAWMQEEKETSYVVPDLTTSGYPVVGRDDRTARVGVDEIRAALGTGAGTGGEGLDGDDDAARAGTGTGLQLLDVRDPLSYSGQPAPADGPGGDGARDAGRDAGRDAARHPGHAAIRGTASRWGHIPGAVNVPVDVSTYPNSRFRTRADLEQAFAHLDPARPTVTYCHTGERSSHLWFVLHHLLGWPSVRSYDGSWVEWGNMVRVPIRVGTET
ncbi:sulfurtransferase [Corynebacterium bovis]|uniref:sulfurtransferase n=1 Tax=Corynebacterium bovis TaxID=36808 RepID=UPI0025500B01|nr:sulfurtransferase [Corynebacterium bovis]MDK8511390.1 sulfurtransferase [Corynebacterium bovis]